MTEDHARMIAAFEREARRADAVLEQLNAAGTRRFSIGDAVLLPSLNCPRCDIDTGQMTGRIIRFEGTSKLEDDGAAGPFYLIELIDAVNHPHAEGRQLVFAEAEIERIAA